MLTTLYYLWVVSKFILNVIFRCLYIISWPLCILTFLLAFPIWVLGFILWKEDSDVFGDTIYDKWFYPLQNWLLDGIE